MRTCTYGVTVSLQLLHPSIRVEEACLLTDFHTLLDMRIIRIFVPFCIDGFGLWGSFMFIQLHESFDDLQYQRKGSDHFGPTLLWLFNEEMIGGTCYRIDKQLSVTVKGNSALS